MPVGAVWKSDSLTAPAASKFIDVLLKSVAMETGIVGLEAVRIDRLLVFG